MNGAFEKNPLIQSGQSLLVSESPVEQAFPIRQDLTSLCEGIGSFKYNHRHAHRRGHLQVYINIYARKMQAISHNIAARRKYFWDGKSHFFAHFFASAPSFLKTMTYNSKISPVSNSPRYSLMPFAARRRVLWSVRRGFFFRIHRLFRGGVCRHRL